MKKTFKLLAITAVCSILTACGTQTQTTEKSTKKFSFKQPNVPMYIQNPAEANQWLLLNYWTNLTPADTTAIDSEELKTAFGNWAMGLVQSPTSTAIRAINQQLKKLENQPLMFQEFIRLGEGFLGDPTSQIRKDSLFIAILDYQLNSPKITELEKIRPQRLKKLTLQNRPGSTGPNISWTNTHGKTGSLYAQRPQFTLVMFYNPGCVSCREIFDALDQDPIIQELIQTKKLRPIALYTDGDLQKWKEYAPSIAPYWENGYTDSDFKTQEPYALRATPSMYLMDKNRKILVKDGTSQPEILEFLK